MTSTASYAHTDAGLLDRAEQGDEAAFTALYRRYYAATRRLAYTYLARGEPDDLVDATFAAVADGLRSHRRPADSFGLHVFATMRRLAGQRPLDAPPGVVGEVPPAVAAVAGRQALGGTDRATIAQAFASLSERWQVVVWHTAIDRCDPSQLGYRLGVSPSAAAIQAQRAGTKLRQAYLEAHLREAPRPGCYPHRERLAALHRRALGAADEAATHDHLDRCDSCRNLVADFDTLDERLAWAVVPLFPFVAVPGPASAPLAIGVPGHEVGTLTPAAGPLPFRSAYTGPRHMAAGPTYGRASDDAPDPYAEADSDDGPVRRPPLAAIAAALTALVVLLGGLAIATTALSGRGGTGDDLEAAADVGTGDGLEADDGTLSTDTTDVTGEADGSSTTGRSSTTATSDAEDTTTSSRASSSSSTSSSSSSSSSSTSAVPSTSSSVNAGPSTTATGPTTSPTTAPQPSPGLGLVLDRPVWRVTDDSEGILTVGVRREEVATVAGVPSTTDVSVTLDVTDDVWLGARLDPRCDADLGRRSSVESPITCTLDAPATGEVETLSFELVVGDADQQVEVSAEQDGADVGTSTTDLVVDPTGSSTS